MSGKGKKPESGVDWAKVRNNWPDMRKPVKRARLKEFKLFGIPIIKKKDEEC